MNGDFQGNVTTRPGLIIFFKGSFKLYCININSCCGSNGYINMNAEISVAGSFKGPHSLKLVIHRILEQVLGGEYLPSIFYEKAEGEDKSYFQGIPLSYLTHEAAA